MLSRAVPASLFYAKPQRKLKGAGSMKLFRALGFSQRLCARSYRFLFGQDSSFRRRYLHQNEMSNRRNAKSYEPRIIVQWSECGNEDTYPSEEAPQQGSNHGAPVPAAVVGVNAAWTIKIAKNESLLSHEPIIGDQHSGDCSHAARIPDQPAIDVAGRILKQTPRLYKDADNARNQSAQPKRDPSWKRIRKIIRWRNNICGNVNCQCCHNYREHRNSHHPELRKVADQFHGIPQLTDLILW